MALEPTLYLASWVLPVSAPAIPDGAVLVGATGRIEALGPAADFAALDAARVELGEAALLPGLVNVHAHPELTAFRGALEDLPFERWIGALVGLKRALTPTGEEWQAAAAWTCLESMAAGVTTIGATEDSGRALDAFVAAGLRGVVYREVFGPDPAEADASLDRLHRDIEAMRRRTTALVRVGVSPHAPYTVSDRLFELTAAYAAEQALPLATHAAEARVEHELVRHGGGAFAAGLRQRGIDTSPRAESTISLLDRTGVLRTRPLLIHCVGVSDADIRRIADAGASVAHCPIANARLAHGVAPLGALLAAGVAVGLGTDSAASNNRLDILEEARCAQLLARARHGSPEMLPAAELLALATIGGARALGLEDEVGSLEQGKAADLCAVRLDGAHVQPVHDPYAAVIHAARGGDVALTAVAGRIVHRDGESLTLPSDRLRSELAEFADRVRRHRGDRASAG